MAIAQITSEATAFGVVGLDFQYQIKSNFHQIYAAMGITLIPDIIYYAITVAEAQPTGLSVDPATGLISGKPAYAGYCNMLLKVTDNFGHAATQPVVFTFKEFPIVANTVGATPGVRCTIARSYFISPPTSSFYNIVGKPGTPAGMLLGGNSIGELTLGEMENKVVPKLEATGMVGKDFFYLIKSDFDATSFAASGLPEGLGVVYTRIAGQSVGSIVGQPKAPGVYAVVISGMDSYGRDATAVLIITVQQSSIEGVPVIPIIAVPIMPARFVGVWSDVDLFLTKRDLTYSNIMVIPMLAIPNQLVRFATPYGQQVALKIYQRLYGLFVDVLIGNVTGTFDPLLGGVLCLDRHLIVRSMYFGFSGDIAFVDVWGKTNPYFTGLGNRYQLVYLQAPLVHVLQDYNQE